MYSPSSYGDSPLFPSGVLPDNINSGVMAQRFSDAGSRDPTLFAPAAHYNSSLPSYNIPDNNQSHILGFQSQLFSSASMQGYHPSPPLSSSPSSSSGDLLDVTVRRVFSTGDLEIQGINEIGSQDGGGMAAGRVGRYTAEERKERIERYRSKRNQRNFQKKITYACRKTLADSRPRVRGRFARNGETDAETEAGTEVDGECHYDGYTYTGHCGSGEYGWQPVLAKTEEECSLEEEEMEMWANVFDGFSMDHLP